MKGRILSVAMALCMIAVVFTALPTKAEVYYTGTVQTMDEDGNLKTVFFQGEPVYVNVTLWYQNVLVDADIRVQIWEGGIGYNQIDRATNDPAVGYYNSTTADPVSSVPTSAVPVSGEMTICDIVLQAQNIYDDWVDVTSVQIVLRAAGITLSPATQPYYPGQDVTVTVATSDTDEFYVEVLDDAGHDLVMAQTEETVDENGEWTWTFEIPADADAGDYWVYVIEEDTYEWWFSAYFEIATFYVDISADRSLVLPGESVTVEYLVYDIASLNLYMEVESEWNAIWWDDLGEEHLETGTLVPSYLGYVEFTIPDDINLSSTYDLHFWVNDTEDRMVTEDFSFAIGQLGGDVMTDNEIDAYPWDPDPYLAGEKVGLEIDAIVWFEWTGYDSEGLPDAEVDIVVEKNGVELPAYGATGLMTGEFGEAVHEFTLADNAEVGTYTVTATISKVGFTVVRMTTFEVDLDYSFSVQLDKDSYYSGETASASFKATWGSETFTNISVFWFVHSSIGNVTYGNTTSGEVTFTIPAGFVGWMSIEAKTTVNGNYLDDDDGAWVYMAFVAVSPAEYEYVAGQTVQWNFHIVTAMTDGLLSYEIVAAGGMRVASTTLMFSTSGSITYTVPAMNPASWYELTLVLKDGLGNEASASYTVYLVAQYTVNVWLVNDSGFVGGAFEPGDEIEVGYEITTNGVAHKSVYQIWFAGDWITSGEWMTVLTTSPTGTLTLTISEEAADGTYYVDVYVYDGIMDIQLAYDWLEVDVEADQSGWSKEVAGMSAIDFVMLVLIVVMIVLLIVVPFLKGRSGPFFKKKEPEPMTMPPEQPPAPPQ